jgi:SPP1 family predicted phage head-tail adaptor
MVAPKGTVAMISRFNEQVEIFRIDKDDNGRGGWNEKEVLLGSFWTYHSPLSNDKKIEFRQQEINYSARFYFLVDSRITENCFIRYKERDYRIVEITIPELGGFFMEVLCDGT